MQHNPSTAFETPSSSETTERELEDFSYMVSHDMAASFRHMREFSRLLLADLGDGLTPRQRGYARRIEAANEHCKTMMEQLLIFSRVQQKPLAWAPLGAAQLMRMTMLRLSAEIDAAQAEIIIQPLGDVHGDEELLALAFRHLLDNAIKFHEPDVSPRIEIIDVSTGRDWTMRICDNGPGVAPDYRDKALRMFQRLNPASAYTGVGAGLAICRRIARRHGGELRFVDQQPRGACIELTIPRPAHVE